MFLTSIPLASYILWFRWMKCFFLTSMKILVPLAIDFDSDYVLSQELSLPHSKTFMESESCFSFPIHFYLSSPIFIWWNRCSLRFLFGCEHPFCCPPFQNIDALSLMGINCIFNLLWKTFLSYFGFLLFSYV